MTYIRNPFAPPIPGLYPTGNVQVTHSTANQDRSESDVTINPINPDNIAGASKKFYDPHAYKFFLGTYYSFDRGSTWNESTLPLNQAWQGMTDPTLRFDQFGNLFLIGEPLLYQNDITGLGMFAYKSIDGGKTWAQPVQLSSSAVDDKQWVTADDRPASPFAGNVYSVWGADQDCGFARSTDHGATWKGLGNAPSPSYISGFYVYAPAITTDSKGWVHIFNIAPHPTSSVQYVRSKDGGSSFQAQNPPVSSLEGLEKYAGSGDFATFAPNGSFRVRTMITAATGRDQTLVVAWPDTRDGVSRIYYRISRDGGENWEGPDKGSPLLPANVNFGAAHCFMPQLTATPNGTIGCAFYVFGYDQPSNKYLIDVYLAASYDDGHSFPYLKKVTDQGWDPAVDAPWSHGDSSLLFIGDYFGLDATDDFFIPFWTDTRTGVQEIFCDRVYTKTAQLIHIPDEVAQILFGVTNDGGGLVIVGGKIFKIPPRSPLINVLEAMQVVDSGEQIGGAGGRGIIRAALNAMKLEINQALKNLAGRSRNID